MAEQFEELGGAATKDPGALRRWILSRVMTHLISPEQLEKKRIKTERQRCKSGLPHRVEYFHQTEDGYSHLAAQALGKLRDRYDIELTCHLVDGPQGRAAPEPELLLDLAHKDAHLIAPWYQLDFPECLKPPDTALLKRATSILAAQASGNFVERAAEIGDALWRGNSARLEVLAKQYRCADIAKTQSALAAGTARRAELGHYSGAMFYYGGEWYWGVDRLYHLEQRLAQLQADRRPGEPLLFPRKAVETGEIKDNGSLTLEVFASLRSPYTAIIFDQSVQLARDTGINLRVRPVLPMVMRGAPITREKGVYIFTDVAREARAAGVDFGKFHDPIGEPIRRCYSLYAWAREQGREIELLSSFLRGAFVEGVNTNSDEGLKTVVERAGLDWPEAQARVGQSGWEEEVEANRLDMYEAGIWGVPSFRLLGADGEALLELWGQDRLWLFAREIQKQLTPNA